MTCLPRFTKNLGVFGGPDLCTNKFKQFDLGVQPPKLGLFPASMELIQLVRSLWLLAHDISWSSRTGSFEVSSSWFRKTRSRNPPISWIEMYKHYIILILIFYILPVSRRKRKALTHRSIVCRRNMSWKEKRRRFCLPFAITGAVHWG